MQAQMSGTVCFNSCVPVLPSCRHVNVRVLCVRERALVCVFVRVCVCVRVVCVCVLQTLVVYLMIKFMDLQRLFQVFFHEKRSVRGTKGKTRETRAQRRRKERGERERDRHQMKKEKERAGKKIQREKHPNKLYVQGKAKFR